MPTNKVGTRANKYFSSDVVSEAKVEYCNKAVGVSLPVEPLIALIILASGPARLVLLKIVQAGGKHGIFWFWFIFSFSSRALDHSATACPVMFV